MSDYDYDEWFQGLLLNIIAMVMTSNLDPNTERYNDSTLNKIDNILFIPMSLYTEVADLISFTIRNDIVYDTLELLNVVRRMPVAATSRRRWEIHKVARPHLPRVNNVDLYMRIFNTTLTGTGDRMYTPAPIIMEHLTQPTTVGGTTRTSITIDAILITLVAFWTGFNRILISGEPITNVALVTEIHSREQRDVCTTKAVYQLADGNIVNLESI